MCFGNVEASAVSPLSVSLDLILLSTVAGQVSILYYQIKASCDFSPKQTLMCLNVQKKRTTAPLMCANCTFHYNHVFRL